MSFTRLDPTDFVVSADSVTTPAWSNNVTTLTSFFTASASSTGSYYVDVYDGNISSPSASVQFSVAYGHYAGSGSAPLNSLVVGKSPSRITFGQFRNLIYGDAESAVNFGIGNTDSINLIAIQVNRNKYKDYAIINIGSVSADGNKDTVNEYAIHKAALEKTCSQLQLIDSDCRVVHLKLGRMNTPMTDRSKDYPRMETEYVTNVIEWIINQPKDILLKNITLDIMHSRRKKT